MHVQIFTFVHIDVCILEHHVYKSSHVIITVCMFTFLEVHSFDKVADVKVVHVHKVWNRVCT